MNIDLINTLLSDTSIWWNIDSIKHLELPWFIETSTWWNNQDIVSFGVKALDVS